MVWRTFDANVDGCATSLSLGTHAGSISTVAKLTNCVNSRTMCHGSFAIVHAGLSRRHWYEMHTGSTGVPPAKAPVRKRSKLLPFEVMPSGAMATMGQRGSLSLHRT